MPPPMAFAAFSKTAHLGQVPWAISDISRSGARTRDPPLASDPIAA